MFIILIKDQYEKPVRYKKGPVAEHQHLRQALFMPMNAKQMDI
jgi:hypothetical protein